MNNSSREQGRNRLIDELTEDLTPVRAFNPRDGVALVAGALALTVSGIAAIAGLRAGLGTTMPSPYFLIANLLLLGVGLAAATAVVAMAGPRVGNRHDAPKWALAMAAVLPLAALASLAGQGHVESDMMHDAAGWRCMAYGTVDGLLAATAMVLWLRRGAPVSPERAGWWTGIAAGGLGSAAYGMHCPVDTLAHLGIFHMLPVLIAGIAGRIAIPPLLRW
ncbi:MAG: DUF1109 domain-containing protein [Sphingomonadales bacterium]|nr:DUF1109 domain-containing protein [Sphingomonadales bacterium]MBD3772692.1 DUF1109 domain-containing protein [Paracoccaceae bacterium]